MADAPLGIAVLGAGRMGREILSAMAADPARFRLAGLWVRDGQQAGAAVLTALAGAAAGDAIAHSDLPAVLADADVAIDFTLPEAACTVADAAKTAGKPLVCGVSGLGAAELAALRSAAQEIAVFYERNMSIGIALLRRAVEEAGRVFGAGAEAEISDLHHAAKIDAPSGTALLLGEALAAARGQDFGAVMRYDAASGHGTRRRAGDIVFDVRREGEHAGRHTVTLANGPETLSFRHEVRDRGVFAVGALRAASWLAGRPPGLYGMADMLAGPGA